MGALIGVEPAVLEMAPALTNLHAECFGRESWTASQVEGSLVQETTKGWVTREADNVTGFILCQMIPKQTEILTFCVRPDRRQQGLGAALLRQTVAATRASGGGRIFLEVAADNHAAKKLYEHHGFSIIGQRPNYYKRGALTVDGVMYAIKVEK